LKINQIAEAAETTRSQEKFVPLGDPIMNVTEELEKLQQLHQSGAINDEEFAQAKAKLLNGQPASGTPFGAGFLSGDAETQTRQWAMFLHLSMLAGFVIPYAGLIAPILIWQLKKTDLPGLDAHGKNATNWIISLFIYSLVCVVLMFVVIGLPLFFLVCLLGIIFPIIAGIKANNGEVWKYPGAIAFFK
jgi:uncharacterized protein